MPSLKSTRRQVLAQTAAGLIEASLVKGAAPSRLPAWIPGTLAIHHISTGRGSCAFVMCPDGTTMMVDCGAYVPEPPVAQYIIGAKPGAQRTPAQWVARYLRRQMSGKPRLDYFVLTHLHGDHCGDPYPGAPVSRFGDYRLTGISELAETVPVGCILDRAYPDYNYPAPIEGAPQQNYRAFVKSFAQRGGKVERFRPGSASQLRLLHNKNRAYPDFRVQNLVANGELWTGHGEVTVQRFPPISGMQADHLPTENMCSLAFRLSYGPFRYFTGGDMSHETRYGALPWHDIETPVARAAGPVTVAVANHHGYVDATGPAFVAALRPRCFVINAWDSAHPTMPAMNNMLSRDLYPEERLIFATACKPESKIAVRQLSKLASDNGHVVFWITDSGRKLDVFVTSNHDEQDSVVKHLSVL